jgi:lysophospholipase L1-like esterase
MGDSLTTAFGVMGSRNPICFFNMKHIQNCRLSWATHLANKFSAEYRIEAVSGKGVMRNSLAVFGKRMPTLFTRITDNSKAFSYQYEDKYLPDILFLCIGHNDFANVKDPTPNNFLNAYREMLDMILNQQFKYFGRGTKIVSVCPMGLINEVCVLVKRAVEEYRYAYKWMYYL